MQNNKKGWGAKLLTWILLFIIMSGVSALIFLIRHNNNATIPLAVLLSDALFIPGIVVLGLVVIFMVARAGTFDGVSYLFVHLRDMSRRDGSRSFADAYEYEQFKKEKRERAQPYLLPYYVLGGIFVVAGLVFLFVMMNG